MRAVLGEKQRAANDEEAKQDESRSRCEVTPALTFMLRMIVHRH